MDSQFKTKVYDQQQIARLTIKIEVMQSRCKYVYEQNQAHSYLIEMNSRDFEFTCHSVIARFTIKMDLCDFKTKIFEQNVTCNFAIEMHLPDY